jgi:hypothetical protein
MVLGEVQSRILLVVQSLQWARDCLSIETAIAGRFEEKRSARQVIKCTTWEPQPVTLVWLWPVL